MIGNVAASSALPSVSDRSGSLAATSSQPLVPTMSHRSNSVDATNTQPPAPTGGVRKEKRAFAGGVWGSDSSATASMSRATGMGSARVVDTASAGVFENTSATPTAATRAVEHGTETGANISARSDRPVPGSSKPDVSGGKRRFAGGVFSVPSSQPSSSATRSNVEASNPFGRGSISVGPGVASTNSGVTGREMPRTPPNPVDLKPAWATESAGDAVAIPDWAVGDSAGEARGGTASPSRGSGQSHALGLAPPSREGQGQAAAEKSVFMRVDADVPVRRPSRRRPGESGEKRAFGGGERLFQSSDGGVAVVVDRFYG